MINWLRVKSVTKGVALAASLMLLESGPGVALPESDLDPRNSIAKEDDWLVVRQAERSGCHLAPVARTPFSPLEFMVRGDGTPVLLTPYERGFKGYIIFTVDKRPPLFVAASLVEDPENLVLPDMILRDLKAGRSLAVWLQPAGKDAQEQTFSLIGLTAALDWLEKSECRVQEAAGAEARPRETR